MVANRVWTTDSSSAKSSTTTSSARSAHGVPATAVSTSRGVARMLSSTRTTSLVVPERVIATSRS